MNLVGIGLYNTNSMYFDLVLAYVKQSSILFSAWLL